MTADDLDLTPVKGADLIRRETLEIEQAGGIGLRHRQIGKRDLVEACELHRPEDIAPGAIERGDLAIFALRTSCGRRQRAAGE